MPFVNNIRFRRLRLIAPVKILDYFRLLRNPNCRLLMTIELQKSPTIKLNISLDIFDGWRNHMVGMIGMILYPHVINKGVCYQNDSQSDVD